MKEQTRQDCSAELAYKVMGSLFFSSVRIKFSDRYNAMYDKKDLFRHLVAMRGKHQICGGLIQRRVYRQKQPVPAVWKVDAEQGADSPEGQDAGQLRTDDQAFSEAAAAPRPAPEAGRHSNRLPRHLSV